MADRQQKKRTSGFTVAIWMFLFFPVGIYFLHKRLTEEETEALKNSKTVRTLGYILILLGVIYIVLFSGEILNQQDNTYIPQLVLSTILFIGGGIWTLIGAGRMRKRGLQYQAEVHQAEPVTQSYGSKAYQNAASENLPPIMDADKISETFQSAMGSMSEMMSNMSANAKPMQPRTRVVECEGCGASNEVTEGVTSKCQFCKKLISYE